MSVNNAVYVDGHKTAQLPSLEETYETHRQRSGIAWIDLYKPAKGELTSVAQEYDLHPLAVEDAMEGHQRAKLERYGDSLFLVLKAAQYQDQSKTIAFNEGHIFVGENFVATVRHKEIPAIDEARRRLESNSELLIHGPEAILYAIVDQVVDDYEPVVDSIRTDIEEIEAEVYSGKIGVSRRIHELTGEVFQFQRATSPLARALERLVEGDEYKIDPEVKNHLRDIHDHALRVSEHIEGFRERLSGILNVNLTSVSIRQNDQNKKISAWAAIVAVPTVIAGIYGMNFKFMPELKWLYGYPLVLGVMILVSVALYGAFKRADWL
jgi:magnesium transporter